ncbi:MAG TPA: hypothetical protein VFL80_02115 [Thermoanaerobaculia bacterium]|nr:hypothetical protein [Thermoanaerobaculia bacterium]
MPGLGVITVVGVVVLAVLIWFFLRTRMQDHLTAMYEKRRSSSTLVSRADYAEGMERIPVVIALANNTFYYENGDLEASFELNRIDEVEYDDELATGRQIEKGCRVLRLRTHGTTFDFVMSEADSAKWQAAVPARRMDAGTAKAV